MNIALKENLSYLLYMWEVKHHNIIKRKCHRNNELKMNLAVMMMFVFPLFKTLKLRNRQFGIFLFSSLIFHL